MNLPSIRSYGQYISSNYGAHSLMVDVGPLCVWFSYTTPVAFQRDGHLRIVRENDWGPTTGKHLNWIDDGDKASRVSGTEFERLWAEALASVGLETVTA